MNTLKTILFFGTDQFSATSLRRLIDEGYSIAAVITKPDAPKGRGRTLQPPLVKIIAEEAGIPVWQPLKLADIGDDIRALRSPLGVLVSYGKIIPQSIIDLFEPGIVNVHPSLLPKYRGPSPIEAAILGGDTETGVSIMQLSAAMDAGPVYSRITHALSGTETTPQLEQTLAEKGAEELVRILPSIIDGSLTPVPQRDDEATYCSLLKKEDGLLDPAIMTAEEMTRRVRAYLAFPKAKINVLGHTLVVTKAHAGDVSHSPLDRETLDGSFFCIEKLVSPSGREMDAASFLNGYVR